MKKLVFIFISLVFFAYGDEFIREYGTYELVKCERKAHDRCFKVSDYTPIRITDFDRDKEKNLSVTGRIFIIRMKIIIQTAQSIILYFRQQMPKPFLL